MPRIPILKAGEIIRALLKMGFRIIRSRGSHHRLEHPVSKRGVTISFHSGDVPRKTVASILRQAGLTIGEFLRHLR